MYFAAANGLPARYSSARWGAQFDDAYGRYQRGQERIYELIFNTRPVHAYLMDGNSLVAQTLVIAHCLGHGYVFENNEWLGRGRPRDHVPGRLRGRADRRLHGRPRPRPGRGLPRRLPRGRGPPAAGPADPQGRRSPSPSTAAPFDVLFPEEAAAERERVATERAALRGRFPREPQEDLLAFIEREARGLEDWQRDVMSIVRSEQSYFVPQMRTKILNEGAAVLSTRRSASACSC